MRLPRHLRCCIFCDPARSVIIRKAFGRRPCWLDGVIVEGCLNMTWKVMERRIGRAGPLKRRTARQREWDAKYGEGCWEVGYILDGKFVTQEEALETIYYRSYEQHFREYPSD